MAELFQSRNKYHSEKRAADNCRTIVIFDDSNPGARDWSAKDWPAHPLARSSIIGAAPVLVYSMGKESGGKNFHLVGTVKHAQSVVEGKWAPKKIADLLHAGMVENGDPHGWEVDFLQEFGGGRKSVLLVGLGFLMKNYRALNAMLAAKRGLAVCKLLKFYRTHVHPKSTMALARGFLRSGITLKLSLRTAYVHPRPTVCILVYATNTTLYQQIGRAAAADFSASRGEFLFVGAVSPYSTHELEGTCRRGIGETVSFPKLHISTQFA
jgi:hypothetical protein